MPGRVPCPAMTGSASPRNSSLTAASSRYAAPVPIASDAAISTQPADGSPYETFSMTSQRRDRIELRAAAQRARHPHAEQPFVVQRLDDGLGEPAVLVAPLGMLTGDRSNGFRSRGQVWRRRLGHDRNNI